MQIEVSMKIVSIEYIEVKYQKQTSSLHVIVITYHGTRLQRVGNSRTMHTLYITLTINSLLILGYLPLRKFKNTIKSKYYDHNRIS